MATAPPMPPSLRSSANPNLTILVFHGEFALAPLPLPTRSPKPLPPLPFCYQRKTKIFKTQHRGVSSHSPCGIHVRISGDAFHSDVGDVKINKVAAEIFVGFRNPLHASNVKS